VSRNLHLFFTKKRNASKIAFRSELPWGRLQVVAYIFMLLPIVFYRLVRCLHRWEEIVNLQYDMAVSSLRLFYLIFI